jgi:hypothetical protein
MTAITAIGDTQGPTSNSKTLYRPQFRIGRCTYVPPIRALWLVPPDEWWKAPRTADVELVFDRNIRFATEEGTTVAASLPTVATSLGMSKIDASIAETSTKGWYGNGLKPGKPAIFRIDGLEVRFRGSVESGSHRGIGSVWNLRSACRGTCQVRHWRFLHAGAATLRNLRSAKGSSL